MRTLNGAYKAGCTLALIPEENMEDLERIRRELLSPEYDNFRVIPVKNIQEVLHHSLLR